MVCQRPPEGTPCSELYNLAAKKGLPVKFVFEVPHNFKFHAKANIWTDDELRGHYRVRLEVAGREFHGEAELPQKAKHEAGELAC